MNYSEFLEYAAKNIKDYLPPEYQEADVRLDTVSKTNEQYTGLTVRQEDQTAAPVVNMKLFYEQYEVSGSLNQIMKDMANVVQMEKPPILGIDSLKDYEQVKNHLFIRVSSPEGNEEIMADSPHRFEADLLMTYHIYMPSQDVGFMSARVTNQMMESYGITEQKMHDDAVVSTAKLMPPRVQSMMKMLTGIEEEEPQMIIVTNEQGTLGAGALFCTGVMDQVKEVMKGDYFILPSSQHEVIAVPDNGSFERSALESMVREANHTVVDLTDKLSDEVYHYDSRNRLFERADAFEKRTQEKGMERGSVLGKLQEKKDQIERTAPVIGNDKLRQTGLAM